MPNTEIFKSALKRLKAQQFMPIERLKELRDLQGEPGNWNYDPYMQGLYNGLELALSIFEDREPEYKDAPIDGWVGNK